MAKFSSSLKDFSPLFLPDAIKHDDKVVDEIFWQQKMKNGRKIQTLKTPVYCGK